MKKHEERSESCIIKDIKEIFSNSPISICSFQLAFCYTFSAEVIVRLSLQSLPFNLSGVISSFLLEKFIEIVKIVRIAILLFIHFPVNTLNN